MVLLSSFDVVFTADFAAGSLWGPSAGVVMRGCYMLSSVQLVIDINEIRQTQRAWTVSQDGLLHLSYACASNTHMFPPAFSRFALVVTCLCCTSRARWRAGAGCGEQNAGVRPVEADQAAGGLQPRVRGRGTLEDVTGRALFVLLLPRMKMRMYVAFGCASARWSGLLLRRGGCRSRLVVPAVVLWASVFAG